MAEKIKKFLFEYRPLIVAAGLWLIPWAIIEFGVKIAGYPGIPNTIVTMYMVLIWVGVIIYVSAERRRARRFVASLKKAWAVSLVLPPLIAANLVVNGASATLSALVIPPMLVGNFASGGGGATIQPPPERTVVHSASPLEFVGIENPLSGKDPMSFSADDPLIKYGEALYQQNCRWCHGENADGKGEFAKGFLPRPANFKDPGTIAQLKQSYLFWRITMGGIEEPFFSAMPRWNEDIDEDERWAIILYEYRHAGVSPRKAAE